MSALRDRIDIETFKIITKSIAQSDDLETMSNHLSRLLVGALEIKGCTLYLLNPDTNELEILATFGMSPQYLEKGPVIANKSIGQNLEGIPVILRDINEAGDALQYPKQAAEEGIGAILSIPIKFSSEVIGVLRLYHRDTWDVSQNDVNTLMVLAEMIGLALRYTNLLNAAKIFNDVLKQLPMDLG